MMVPGRKAEDIREGESFSFVLYIEQESAMGYGHGQT